MLKQKTSKRLTSYPLLLLLILQLGFSGLLCAISGYQAGASTLMICTSFGIQTVTIDENGQPIEQSDHSALDGACFHCASGGCGSLALLPQETEPFVQRQISTKVEGYQSILTNAASPPPPTRAPPFLA